MRNDFEGDGSARCCSRLIGIWAVAPRRAGAERRRAYSRTSRSTRCCTIPARGQLSRCAKRVSLGVGKSLLVQFPFELKDVLVSDPDKVDAVVQSSNRVFLIAKKLGQTNAFFFDTKGQQILTLEIAVGADLKGLDGILQALRAGLQHQAEMAGSAVVLTGSVRTPLDAKRAADIACQFVAANKDVASSAATQPAGGSSNSFGDQQTSTTQSADQYEAQDAEPGGGLRQRQQARHQPAHHRGRRAGDAQGDVAEVQRSHAQAVRHQHRRRHQLRQLLDRDPDARTRCRSLPRPVLARCRFQASEPRHST